MRFGINPEIFKMLDTCREKRNDPNWLNYCKDIITKFHPTKVEHILVGNIRKLNNFVLFLKEDIKKYKDAEKAEKDAIKKNMAKKAVKVNKEKAKNKTEEKKKEKRRLFLNYDRILST